MHYRIEIVIGQLVEQFHAKQMWARDAWHNGPLGEGLAHLRSERTGRQRIPRAGQPLVPGLGIFAEVLTTDGDKLTVGLFGQKGTIVVKVSDEDRQAARAATAGQGPANGQFQHGLTFTEIVGLEAFSGDVVTQRRVGVEFFQDRNRRRVAQSFRPEADGVDIVEDPLVPISDALLCWGQQLRHPLPDR